jgi:hypothetical protein
MAINRSLFRREPSLRPSRRPGLPVRTLLRAALVAALLTLAAGVVYARESPARCPAAASPERPVEAESAPPTSPGRPVEADSAPPPLPGRSAGGDSGAGRPGGGPGRPALPDGLVGVPVRLADAAPAAIVRAGDRVDLLAVPDPGRPVGSATPMLVATRALVLDVVTEGLTDDSTALYLALPAEQARRVTVLGTGHRFAIMVRS